MRSNQAERQRQEEEQRRQIEEQRRADELRRQQAAEQQSQLEEQQRAEKERFAFAEMTALDKKTKLMWTRDANIARKPMNWDKANEFVMGLNNSGYAGYHDWRLPSKKELLTLVDYAKSQGVSRNLYEFFNRIGFAKVQWNHYWSSTTLALPIRASIVDFYGDGGVDSSFKANVHNVWCVRGGQ